MVPVFSIFLDLSEANCNNSSFNMTSNFENHGNRFTRTVDYGNIGLFGTALSYGVNLLLLLFYVHDKHLRSCQDGQLT